MEHSQKYQTAPNVTIHARITTPPTSAAKRPLLGFIHYYGGTSSTWYKVTSLDSKTSLSTLYPTVSIDLRGWGESTAPLGDDGNEFSVTNMAADISSFIAQMHQDTQWKALLEYGLVLVGHSMGAKIALTTIHTLPAEVLDVFKGFVLVAPAPPTPLFLSPEMRAQQQSAYTNEDTVRAVLADVLADTGKLTSADIEMVIRDSLGGTDLAKKATPVYGMQEDVTEKILLVPGGVSVQAVVLIGENDRVEPEERVLEGVVEFIKKKKVNVSSVTTIPGVKHLIPLEAPGVLYDEIRSAFP